MEQQNGNNMTNNVIDANFNIISHFLSSALRNVEFSDIIRSEGRTVFVSMAKETKQIVIPEKNTHIIEWKQAWLAVFENYLKALDDKVGSLFMNSKYIKEVGDYGVKVGNHPVIQIPNDYNSVAYANALEEIINSKDSTKEEKNNAYEELKTLNNNKGLEETITKKLKDDLELESFVKITNDEVEVVVEKDSHDVALASQIMNLVQQEFTDKVSVSVRFTK